ncbi:PGF-pre-PGF domain-containing protein [Methanolobus sp. ZRKC3]|uniref:PGF-pre-PGF domain-containing protein n=1 Tax=Methanolobus sp. ZRKC3 TaxID=3125786 RepID=UPI003251C54B
MLSVFYPVMIASAAPGSPVNLGYSTGGSWILHTWDGGSGDLTDSYNVSYDGNWYNSTASEFNHTGIAAHGWSNITVYAYNTSSSNLSLGANVSVQLPNNDINITDIASSVSVSEGESIIVDANFTDADFDMPFFSCNRTDNFTDFNTSTGTGSWVADYIEKGIYYVEFGVSDGYGSTDTHVMLINRYPILDVIGSKNTTENLSLTFTLSASDSDGNHLTFDVIDIPSGAVLNATTGVFEWTPDFDQAGSYDVEFRVFDGYVNDSEFVSINVTNVKIPDNEATKTTSSGGGGGGASLTTGEKFENIDFKDYAIKSVLRERETVFDFVRENNSIVSLSFTSALNGGQTKTLIELLKDTSSLVNEPAPGVVYQNMNIWVGDGKFTPAMVSDARIMFKIEKSWMEEKEVTPSSIRLCRHSGSWQMLKTSPSGEDDIYMYFIAESPGFSSFAISSVGEDDLESSTIDGDESSMSLQEDEQILNSVDDVLPEQPETVNQETKSSKFGISIVLLLGVIAICFYGYRNRDYYSKVRSQIGNPDGKRYRRIKR